MSEYGINREQYAMTPRCASCLVLRICRAWFTDGSWEPSAGTVKCQGWKEIVKEEKE